MENIKMNKTQTIEVFESLFNQLEGYEQKELLSQLIPKLSKKDVKEIIGWSQERFPNQTYISLVENGIIEED